MSDASTRRAMAGSSRRSMTRRSGSRNSPSKLIDGARLARCGRRRAAGRSLRGWATWGHCSGRTVAGTLGAVESAAIACRHEHGCSSCQPALKQPNELTRPGPPPAGTTGLIFDCDGTLADTMPAHYKAWTAMLGRYGIPFPEPRFYAMGGMPTARSFAYSRPTRAWT